MSRSFLVSLIALIGLVVSLITPAHAQLPAQIPPLQNWLGTLQTPSVGVVDLSKTGHPTCGGLETWRDGWPAQQSCARQPAVYEGPAVGIDECKQTFDLTRWECWSCDKSKGFERSVAAVDSPRACFKREPSAAAQFTRATRVGPLCPDRTATFEKSFWDPIRGGECWACPTGYQRTAAHVEAGNACINAEQFAKPTVHGASTGLLRTDCPRGQSWDPIAGGICWSCPAGFNRTGYAVNDERGCVRPASGATTKATVQKIGKCEADAFADPRNGGECWKCQEPYDRTGAAVDSAQACQTTPGMSFARATLVTPVACPAGQHWDLTKVTQGELDNRDGKRVWGLGANPKATNGATCWSCPSEYARTLSGVKDGGACESTKGMEWYSPPQKAPGLFGLDGANEVALEVLRDRREDVNKIIRMVIDACATSGEDAAEQAICKQFPQRKIAEIWEDMASAPEQSPYLGLVLLNRISLAVSSPSQATAAERRLKDAFAAYVQKRREIIADDALRAFDHWLLGEKYRQLVNPPQGMLLLFNAPGVSQNVKPVSHAEAVAQLRKQFPQFAGGGSGSASAQTVGIVPPDWYETAMAATMASVTGTGIAAGVLIYSVPGLRYAVFPGAKVRDGIIARSGATGGGTGGGGGTSGGGGGGVGARTTEFSQHQLQQIEKVEKAIGRKLTGSMRKHVGSLVGKEGVKRASGKVASAIDDFIYDAVKITAKRIGAGIGGALAVLGVVIEVGIEVIQQISDIADMDRAHVLALQAQAKQPVDLARMFLTEEGVGQVQSYWTLAMSGDAKASPTVVAQVKTIATAVAADFQKPKPQAVAQAGANVLAAKPAAQMAAISSDPRAMPKYFNGVQAMGPYVWQDGPATIAGGLRGAVIGGQEGNRQLALCRASHQGGVHPGKVVGNTCNIGWGGSEIALASGFQVLVRATAQQNEQYFPTDNWRAPNELPQAATFYAGYEGQNWMRACRAQHNNAWHPGKEHNGRCNIGWGGKEMVLQSYQVLSLFNTAVGGNRNGN